MKIGDKISFVPSAFFGEKFAKDKAAHLIPRRVTGTIIKIHKAHRYCRVEYQVHNYTLHECFKIRSLEDRKNENNRNHKP